MLHNYSCPVARVMVCIGALRLLCGESRVERSVEQARLLGLMMESS